MLHAGRLDRRPTWRLFCMKAMGCESTWVRLFPGDWQAVSRVGRGDPLAGLGWEVSWPRWVRAWRGRELIAQYIIVGKQYVVLAGERETAGTKYVISSGNRNDLMNVSLACCLVLSKKPIVGPMTC